MVPKWNGKWRTIANREPETELNIGGTDREGNGDNVKNKQIKNLLRYAVWQAGPNIQDSWHNINFTAGAYRDKLQNKTWLRPEFKTHQT